MSKILGIDLGTTNSAMAVIEGGEPTIIENAEGVRTTPSIVAISKTKERLVGLIAKRQAVTNPKNTIFGIKRYVGHRFEDAEIQKDEKTAPFDISKSSDGGVLVKLGDKEYRPEEVSAMILQKLKNDAEDRLGYKINEAVITVPAYFNDSQRKATKAAGKIAGPDVTCVISLSASPIKPWKSERVFCYSYAIFFLEFVPNPFNYFLVNISAPHMRISVC